MKNYQRIAKIGICFIVIFLAIANTIFRFDQYCITRYSIWKFCRGVKNHEFDKHNTSLIPLEHLREIPNDVVEQYLVDTQDIVLASWIVGWHDNRFLHFFNARMDCGEGRFFDYLKFGAIWLSEFGCIPINGRSEFLAESAEFDEFFITSNEISSTFKEKGLLFDYKVICGISATELGWKKLCIYKNKQKAITLKRAIDFFNMAQKLTDIDGYKYYWGLGEAYRLKSEVILYSNIKKNTMEQSIAYYSLVKHQQIPEDLKNEFFMDFANAYIEISKIYYQVNQKNKAISCLNYSKNLLTNVLRSSPSNNRANFLMEQHKARTASFIDDAK